MSERESLAEAVARAAVEYVDAKAECDLPIPRQPWDWEGITSVRVSRSAKVNEAFWNLDRAVRRFRASGLSAGAATGGEGA